MTDWLFTRKALLTGLGILAVAVVLGIAFREGPLGNVMSVVGVAVSFLGFIVTIWTVLDARQQIREAADRAEKAVTQVQDEARRAVEAIAAQLLAADCAALRSGLEDLRQATLDGQWPRAVYRCHDCWVILHRLQRDRRLTSEEASVLETAGVELRLIHRFIEKYRMAGQSGSLKDSDLDKVDDLIALLAQIQGRLHHEALRPVEMPPHHRQ